LAWDNWATPGNPMYETCSMQECSSKIAFSSSSFLEKMDLLEEKIKIHFFADL
jgi:hypothetical protein